MTAFRWAGSRCGWPPCWDAPSSLRGWFRGVLESDCVHLWAGLDARTGGWNRLEQLGVCSFDYSKVELDGRPVPTMTHASMWAVTMTAEKLASTKLASMKLASTKWVATVAMRLALMTLALTRLALMTLVATWLASTKLASMK
jgi:hypothetical protein